jgi:membrane protein DedA with SNARE-associated domain
MTPAVHSLTGLLHMWSDAVVPFVARWGLLVVFAMPLVEHTILVGYFAIATSTLLAFGFISGSKPALLLPGILLAVLGCGIGSQLSRFVGGRWGHRVLRHMRANTPEQIPAALDRSSSVVGGIYHFSVLLRPTVPAVAGSMGVPLSWIVPDVAGAFVWVSGLILIGYNAGAAVEEGGKGLLFRLVFGLLGLVAFVAFALFVRSYFRVPGRAQ